MKLASLAGAWQQRTAAIVAGLVLAQPGALFATEKYWIAHEASLIVVGTLRPKLAYPWFDGWGGLTAGV